jgi:murein DD-endopeptidase MepM/ murein hydrolase activator NlpD
LRNAKRLALLCVALSFSSFTFQGCDRAAPAPEASAPALPAVSVPVPQAPVEPTLRYAHHTLGRGGTLDAGLEALDLAPELRREVIAALAEHVDMRRLRPETGLAVGRDENGEVVRVSCRPSPDRFVRLDRGADGSLHGESVVPPVETALRSVGGVVRRSVAQALADEDDSVHLTAEFAEIFQWDVDLLVEPRSGDRVRVVYETRRLGPLPDDLPPYDGAASEPGERLGIGRILAASYDGAVASSRAFFVAEGGAEGDGAYYDDEGQPLHKTFLKSPLNYRRISSRFSRARRNPVTRKVVPHHGVDYAAARGTPVVSTADGRVVSARWNGALGRAVTVRHGAGYETIYGHLNGFAKGIRAGATVRQNQVIGYVGSTGRATGPHLHYTMKLNGRAMDPLRFESPPAEPLDPTLLPLLAEVRGQWLPVLDRIDPTDPGVELARAQEPERPAGVGI